MKKKMLYEKSIDEFGNLNDAKLLALTDFEEFTNYDNIKNPFNFRAWWNTLSAASEAPYEVRVKIYESALEYLPGSYKLWYNYLKEARENIEECSIDDKRFSVINDIHERALVFMNKMPKIWLDYCEFLMDQRLVTKTRKTFDKALKSLPVTQHEKIWKLYISWASTLPVAPTSISIFRRYIKLNPDIREEFIEYLLKMKYYDETLKNIIDLINDSLFYSKKGQSKFDYWLLLCDIITKHPYEVREVDCEAVIRHGLSKYTDEVGRLWVALCNYYIKQGLFDKTRDIFEEALSKISTARDFSLVFNAYLKFEEELVSSLMLSQESEMEVDEEQKYDQQLEKLVDESFKKLKLAEDSNYPLNVEFNENLNISFKEKSNLELELKLFRMTNLIERRPFLLSDALLRQNPNNVKEWLKRVKLCKDDAYFTEDTYEKAVNTVDPQKAFGRPDALWISYALYFEEHNRLDKANEVFNRASKVYFKNIDQNVNIWCEWAEMHIRGYNFYDAYEIVKVACTGRRKEKGPNLTHSLRLWTLYVDLEEHLGTLDNVKAIYQRIIDLKIANTETIFNFCNYLEANSFYEETFKVYEQAINYFTWPQVYDIWLTYLAKFVDRYKGEKVERARDLFEQVVNQCPKDQVKIFYYMYSEFEEHFGLLNHAIRILDKGCSDVLKEDRAELFSVLIAKTANFFGITKTRHVFNRALETLEGDQVIDIGLKYSTIEKKLGEIDRARSILTHISQFADPSKEDYVENFWKIWDEFELSHGNEDTYKEMLRVKRSVMAKHSLNVPLYEVENKLPV